MLSYTKEKVRRIRMPRLDACITIGTVAQRFLSTAELGMAHGGQERRICSGSPTEAEE